MENLSDKELIKEVSEWGSLAARGAVLALITERDQLRAQSEYRVKAWSREVDEVNAALAAAEERMAAMEGALRKIGSMLSVAHDFDCFDDKCEGNCGDPEKMCDSCRMADACIDAGYTIIAALDAPIEDSLRADLAAAKDEAEDIATLLRVSDSLLAAENALYAALEGVVGEMIFHSSRKDGECL